MAEKLSAPMRLVLECISQKGNPSSLYNAGQLRKITSSLVKRGLIRSSPAWQIRSEWHLTVTGRNYITEMRRANDR